jgi:hypothetical protein
MENEENLATRKMDAFNDDNVEESDNESCVAPSNESTTDGNSSDENPTSPSSLKEEQLNDEGTLTTRAILIVDERSVSDDDDHSNLFEDDEEEYKTEICEHETCEHETNVDDERSSIDQDDHPNPFGEDEVEEYQTETCEHEACKYETNVDDERSSIDQDDQYNPFGDDEEEVKKREICGHEIEAYEHETNQSLLHDGRLAADDDQSNPFGEDETEDVKEEIKAEVSEHEATQSMNPFGDDDYFRKDERNEPPTARKEKTNFFILNTTKRVDSFNPFDDGDEEENEIEREKMLDRRKAVTESLAPFTLASMVPDPDPNANLKPNLNAKNNNQSMIRYPTTQVEHISKKFHKEIHELMVLGFDKVCVTNAVQKASGNVLAARKLLMSRLFDDHLLTNEEVYVWKSPVMVRVGKG